MFGKNKLNLNDLCHFFKVIQRYGSANIPFTESVPLFAEEVKKPSLKKILEILIRDLKNGVDFPTALSKHPSFFPAFIVEMVKVGQSSGQTQTIQDEVVFHLEQEIDIKREVNSALWTPKAFLVGMFILFAICFFFVIPKLGELLSDANIELPLITQMVVGLGNLAQSLWWLFLLLSIGSVFLYRYFCREYPERVDLFKLKIPFFKVITYNQIQYGFAKIFGLCIQAGLGSKRSLHYAATASNNVVLKNTLKKAVNDIEKTGASLPDAIRKADVYKIINPAFYIMLQVGASTSDLGNIMLKESENYRKELVLASKLIGDKVGLSVLIPGYAILIILFASVEYPILTMMQNINMVGG